MTMLKPLQAERQEKLRALTKPLRITDQWWDGTHRDRRLEAARVRRKFEGYGVEYAQQVNTLRREWGTEYPSDVSEVPFPNYNEFFEEDPLDSLILYYKLWTNYRWAKERDNKYLLAEDVDAFPCMNYILGEGPYTPPLDAKFGPEDKQIILEVDGGNLVFFQTELDGLTKGRYVEYLG